MSEHGDGAHVGRARVRRRRDRQPRVPLASDVAELPHFVVVAKDERRAGFGADHVRVRNGRCIREVGGVAFLEEDGEGRVGIGERADVDDVHARVTVRVIDDRPQQGPRGHPGSVDRERPQDDGVGAVPSREGLDELLGPKLRRPVGRFRSERVVLPDRIRAGKPVSASYEYLNDGFTVGVRWSPR